MPCTPNDFVPPSSGPSDSDFRDVQRRIADLENRLVAVTKVACEMARVSNIDPSKLSPESAAWLAQHRAWDKSQGR